MARHYMTLFAAVSAAATLYQPSFASPPDEYPLQADKTVNVSGQLTAVDRDRERVSLKAADGRLYAVDVYQTKITVNDASSAHSGTVADLVVGQRVKLQGYLLSDSVLAADRLSILPSRVIRSTQRQSVLDEGGGQSSGGAKIEPPVRTRVSTVRPPVKSTSVAPKYFHAEKIRLRGTVDDVDDTRGIITVRVADHMRTIAVSPKTDLTDISDVDDTHIGVSPGERITVLGTLAEDGTVRASAISRSKDIDKVATKPGKDMEDDHHLIGQVSKRSDRFSGRDIKIRVRPNREVGIEVGRDIPIVKHGRRVSVHDLTTDDVVRIQGEYDGSDFRAQQIDVLETYPQD